MLLLFVDIIIPSFTAINKAFLLGGFTVTEREMTQGDLYLHLGWTSLTLGVSHHTLPAIMARTQALESPHLRSQFP